MFAIAFALLLAQTDAGAAATQGAAQTATAKLKDGKGKSVGTAKFEQTAHGVLISIDLHGLKAGTHAIHLHEVGKCDGPDFKSAGGHFNPMKKQHGFMTAEGPHAGDMPNIDVPANGKIKAELLAPEATLDQLMDADGAALVVHAKPDDYKSQPAGDAGDRVACGVIEKS
jgi:Cu-Zn family superoxide dismutase